MVDLNLIEKTIQNCKKKIIKRIVSAKENKSQFIVKRADGKKLNIYEIKFDECLKKSGIEHIACDYIYFYMGIIIYLELKGKDVCHAAKQIFESAEIIRKINLFCNIRESKAFIISVNNRIPSSRNQMIMRRAKDLKIDIYIKSRKYELLL